MSTELRDSRGAEVVLWIERNVVHGEGDMVGQPFLLRPDQKLLVFRWYEVDGAGDWWFERLYKEDAKGDGKTMLFAAIGLAELFGPTAPERPNVVVAANSREQAGEVKGGDAGEGIFGRMVQIVEHDDCPIKPHAQVFEDRIVRADGRSGRIRLIAANESTTDGGLPHLFIADEVQDWTGGRLGAHQRNENSTTKLQNGRSMSCSTPGAYAGQPSVGWQLHHYAMRIITGELDDDRFLYESHAAPREFEDELDDPDVRRRALLIANPGISERRLERLVRRWDEIPHSDWCRFHLAWWMEGDQESWLIDHPGAWAACQTDEQIPDGARITVGVDLARSRDTMSVAWAWRSDLTGRWVVRAKVWEAAPHRGIDLGLAALWITGAPDEPDIVAGLAERYEVASVAYDPRYWDQIATRIGDEGIETTEWPQTVPRMSPADGVLYDLILSEGVAHDGDPILAQHVNAAVRRDTESGWYLSKGRALRPMDACRAVVLAVAEGVAMENTQPVEVGARWL